MIVFLGGSLNVFLFYSFPVETLALRRFTAIGASTRAAILFSFFLFFSGCVAVQREKPSAASSASELSAYRVESSFGGQLSNDAAIKKTLSEQSIANAIPDSPDTLIAFPAHEAVEEESVAGESAGDSIKEGGSDQVLVYDFDRLGFMQSDDLGFLFPGEEDVLPSDESLVSQNDDVCNEAFCFPENDEIAALVAELEGPRRLSFVKALQRSELYIAMIEKELGARNLPLELVYLPLVESHFQSRVVSSAGAVGLWQFIDSTARNSGLLVNWWVDERLDPEASTLAAISHLEELYAQFNDWELALAAYNAGPNGIRRALEKSGADTYWDLVEKKALSLETMRYVPKFYAALRVAKEFSDKNNFSEVAEPEDRFSEVVGDKVFVKSPVSLRTVASLSQSPLNVVQKLNPALLRGCTPPGVDQYFVRVPKGKGAVVQAAMEALPDDKRLTFMRHEIMRGDTLWGIARQYGTESSAIAELNDIKNPKALRLGSHITVPVPRGGKNVSRTNRSVHVVKKGESLWGISRFYGVELSDLIKSNNLDSNSVIRPGDELIVASLAEGPS